MLVYVAFFPQPDCKRCMCHTQLGAEKILLALPWLTALCRLIELAQILPRPQMDPLLGVS